MKVALLICTYNRPAYLKQLLWSLERADLSEIDFKYLVDDGSTDVETLNIIKNNKLFVYTTYAENSGIKKRLLDAYEILFKTYDIVINLDSDAIVRPDFLKQLIENYIPETLLTGFHCTTKNANGSERHLIIDETETLYKKQSVGGINFCIDKYAYENFVMPSLLMAGNWDHNSCIIARCAYSLKKSVIQHIGFDSSMNHNEAPDVADDFKYWYLPDVTLIGADSEPKRLQEAANICQQWIEFGDVKLITHSIRSKEQYSHFCIDEFYKHVNTSHMLICQHDGFVHNWQAWDNDWLQYDYIGAPWHYNDGMAVGNGGFSLRSKRLMEIVAKDEHIQFKHPEDHHICRTYRPYLEEKYGIKFAPIEVAEKFSFEGYLQPGKGLTNQFGRHGSLHANTRGKKANERYVFNQFLSLGDILFLIPMYRALINEGNTVLWPIDPMYLSIAKHFPDVNFVNKEHYDLPYDSKQAVQTEYGKLLPYRFACEVLGRTLHKCMESKYNLYHHDHNMWRQLHWQRDWDNEKKLLELLQLPERFVLVNRTYGHLAKAQVEPIIEKDLPIIEMSKIDGFTLIDWMSVVEKATEIHASNSSLNYLIELSNIQVPVHLYRRKMWGEIGFEYTMALWTKPNFIFHEK